jgi:hypothetical protein
MDENDDFIKDVEDFQTIIPKEDIPEGIDFESFAEVYEACYMILYI